MATEMPDLSGFRVELIHREILRKLAWHEAKYHEASDLAISLDPKTARENAVSSAYNLAAHDTLRDLRGLLEMCIESERRERAAYAAAQDC